jgi:hypothetical protein
VAELTQPCHFGEWLQGRLGPQGPVVLVTLLPEGLALSASLRASDRLSVACQGMTGSFPAPVPALQRFLTGLDLPATGSFTLHPAYTPGLGTGASTASLIAMARLAGFKGAPDALAEACVAAEGASDPLMYPQADRLLWASRQGKVMAHLPPVPKAELVTGFFGPPLPTKASDEDYDDISDLIEGWKGCDTLAGFAALASESAARCLARRGPADDPTAAVAKDLGALGWATSHSGAARALIFAPGAVPAHAMAACFDAGLRDVVRMVTGR